MALDDASIWRILGISPTENSNEIRRAYAKRLRAVHPEDDPQGFNELRLAYEAATDGARLSSLRAIEQDLKPTARPLPMARSFEPPRPRVEGRPPPVASLTIDQMLDELALDEHREPELEHLRQLLALLLRPPHTPQERVAALQRIFRSEAMRSSRLYAETEIWVALLLRGSFPETEALIEPSVAFFGWDGDHRSPHGDRVLQRRDAIVLFETLNDPGHRLHKALIVLERPFLNSYALQYSLSLRLRRRVAELMKIVDENRELECILDYESLAWWRRHLKSPGLAPFVLLGAVLLPLGIAKLTTSSDYSDYDGTTFAIVWLTVLCGFLLIAGLVIAVAHHVRNNKSAGSSWIEDLGEAAP